MEYGGKAFPDAVKELAATPASRCRAIERAGRRASGARKRRT